MRGGKSKLPAFDLPPPVVALVIDSVSDKRALCLSIASLAQSRKTINYCDLGDLFFGSFLFVVKRNERPCGSKKLEHCKLQSSLTLINLFPHATFWFHFFWHVNSVLFFCLTFELTGLFM